MSALLSGLIAGIPKAFLAVLGRLMTQKFLEAILKKVIIYGLEKLAKMSKTTIDDELVADMKKQLNAEG